MFRSFFSSFSFFFLFFLLNLLIVAATGNTKSIYDPIRKFHNLTRKVWNRTFYSIKQVEESLFHGSIFTRLLSSEQQRGGERTRAPTIGWSLVTTDPCVNFSTFPRHASVFIILRRMANHSLARIPFWELYLISTAREKNRRSSGEPSLSIEIAKGWIQTRKEREREREKSRDLYRNPWERCLLSYVVYRLEN